MLSQGRVTTKLRERVSLKDYSTIKIGGQARFFAEAESSLDFLELITWSERNSLPWFVLGKGSNTLFRDEGFEGLVILNKYASMKHLGDGIFRVSSGFSLPLFATKVAQLGFGGFEFALAIPGTMGGAIFMNAGASGLDTSRYLKEVTFLSKTGEIITFQKEELLFGYRTSQFQKLSGIILDATFQLKPDKEARSEQLKIFRERSQKQPLEEASLGCVFRNPEGTPCGKLVEEMGLKGTSLGGALVSPLHGNFITNHARATAKDVLDLISLIEKKALNRLNICLEREIRVI